MARAALTFTLLVLSLTATAQPASRGGRDGGWFTVGAGVGDPYGSAVMATANLGSTRFAQIGLHTSGEFNLFDISPVLTSVHLGAGLSRVDRWTRLAVAVGPALVFERDTELQEGRGIGALVNGQVAFTPIPELGLGLNAYAHTSGVGSGYGVGITLVFERNK